MRERLSEPVELPRLIGYIITANPVIRVTNQPNTF